MDPKGSGEGVCLEQHEISSDSQNSSKTGLSDALPVGHKGIMGWVVKGSSVLITDRKSDQHDGRMADHISTESIYTPRTKKY